MPDWIQIGDDILNVDNIEHVVHISPTLLQVHMISGTVIEVTEGMSVAMWNYLVSQRLPFYDTVTPTRDFSGT